jgi:hypothetical protein
MTDNRLLNQTLLRSLVLPTVFLTVTALGGLRVSAEETSAFVFIAPPLVTLVLAVLLMLLFARGGLLQISRWLSGEHSPLSNATHFLTLTTLFFASAQAFNAVLPERGLFHWLFAFFFLWTLWQNQFATFDARRLLRSLAALFGTAFVLKHMLLASLYAPESNWVQRIAGVLLEGISLGTVDAPRFAPATGYIAFFALALYVAGLILLPPAPAEAQQIRRSDTRHLPSPANEAINERQHVAISSKPDDDSVINVEEISEESASDEEVTIVRERP